METKTMKAIGVAKYGAVDNFESRDVPRPGSPTGMDILIQVKACSVNPIDTKVRKGTYDDAPDYYKFVPKGFHIIGFDGAGTVLEVGPECTNLKPGDDVFFVSSTTRQGSAAEYVLVDERICAEKPKSLDFVEAASMGLTFGTAYQSLIDRLEIKQNENVGILIINGGGGVGSAAIQIARKVLQLPVVIATASRPETMESCRKMGATHVVNHRVDLESQIKALNLGVPIRYVYVVARTEQYIYALGKICAPFAKVCSIVQAKFDLYGTDFMSKSMTFSWDWLGTSAYHRTNLENYRRIFGALARYIDEGKLVPNLNKRLKLNLAGLKEAHQLIESATTMGKLALGVDEPGEGAPFT
ncbi:zinc-type alcohol dehydrogenase-like protein SA1988 [Aspergillus udagawae]|uniref:Zinc-type alcohol dehydrogenase-like protein SA1988 n=1 Tax=Aspergillus udagawae TaxID=91492 RepID=A0ABQ1BE56_9EURO|nr:zinc-type alcohol dehydrogenase-like protein SA1988 [Aspergillus udagawae]GFG19639.1 zinc-type alcohol dehydrogenase-like protein SA1988 [Aspergillus udagawae]